MANVEDKQFETKTVRPARLKYITSLERVKHHFGLLQRAASQKHVQYVQQRLYTYRIGFMRQDINQRANYSASLFRTRGEFKR